MPDPNEARERLEDAAFEGMDAVAGDLDSWSKAAVAAILSDTEALATLLDPATMLAEWERQRRLDDLIETAAAELAYHSLQQTDCDCPIPGGIHFHWRCTCDLWHTVALMTVGWHEHIARVVFESSLPTPTEEAPRA